VITDKHNPVFHLYVGTNLLIYNAVVEKVSKYAFVFFTINETLFIQGGSNMTGTDLCVNKPHCAAVLRP